MAFALEIQSYIAALNTAMNHIINSTPELQEEGSTGRDMLDQLEKLKGYLNEQAHDKYMEESESLDPFHNPSMEDLNMY